jgi:hypothetical protein
MTHQVPVFRAAQGVARALFGAEYLQQRPLVDTDDRGAAEEIKAIRHKQEQMFRDACNRLYDGFKSGALTLLGTSPNGERIFEMDDFILQYANPYQQVTAGKIIVEDYRNHGRVKPFNNFDLSVPKSELDRFLQIIGAADANRASSATSTADGSVAAPRGEDEKPPPTKSVDRTTADQKNEAACGRWIQQLAEGGKVIKKEEVLKLAKDEWPKLSKNAFNRAWAAKAPTEWRTAGRRKKS